MTVSLRGSSPSALTAAILLLSRARRLGQVFDVEVVGEPYDITPVRGPALLHSPVLASCGVGRELGTGALVVLPGPADVPLAVSTSQDGTGQWFTVDRAGVGAYEETRAFVRLFRQNTPAARMVSLQLSRALQHLGCPLEPAIIDLLIGSPLPPLDRVALALRAGRAITGDEGIPLHRFLTPAVSVLEAVPPEGDPAQLLRWLQSDHAVAFWERFALSVRVAGREMLANWAVVGAEDPEALELLSGLVELASTLVCMPTTSMLPPLDASSDAVACGVAAAIGATRGNTDANAFLVEMFRFLGGRFVDSHPHPIVVDEVEAPEDRLERWQWFCHLARGAADQADSLWSRVVDPMQ